MIHIAKGFSTNKAAVDVFLEFSCFHHNLTDVGNLISGSSAFSICVCGYISHFFLIYSSTDGYLGCFHILTIVNYVIRIMRMKIIPSNTVISFLLDIYTEVELLGYIGSLIFIF